MLHIRVATTKQKMMISKIRKNGPLKSSYVAPRVKELLNHNHHAMISAEITQMSNVFIKSENSDNYICKVSYSSIAVFVVLKPVSVWFSICLLFVFVAFSIALFKNAC